VDAAEPSYGFRRLHALLSRRSPIGSILESPCTRFVPEHGAGRDHGRLVSKPHFATMPTSCVVIPTYNRVDTLLRCLAHLQAQTYKEFEVVIVDDGSTDDTPALVERYKAKAPFPLRYIRQRNSGPARARNVAIAQSGAELTVMIGDDILAMPDFVERHIEFHAQHPGENVVAIGLTRWCEDGQTVTNFMRWLDADGIQFGFGSLLAGRKPDWHDFYTSNMSFKTSYLQAHPFDETFPGAGYEDLELGLRLKRRHDLQLDFFPSALAEHLHPTDFMRSCRRMQDVGGSAYILKQRWPEFGEFPTLPPSRRRVFELLSRPGLLFALSHAARALTGICCPNPLTRRVLNIHGRVGYDRAAAKHASNDKPAA